jgi:hypothetical protein
MPRKVLKRQHTVPTLAELKLISEDEVPAKLRGTSEQWINLVKGIPKGQALSGTEREFGVSADSVKAAFLRLKKIGLLSNDYHVTQRTRNGAVTIYIVHSAKTTEE